MKIVFLKPYLEVDAVWDPIRTSVSLGIWYLASKLRKLGHEVWYLDETVRGVGLQLPRLRERTLYVEKMDEGKPSQIWFELRRQKLADYLSMGPDQFVSNYSAFRSVGEVQRTILRLGNPLDSTLQKLAELSPDLVCIPLTTTAAYLPAVRTAKLIRTAMPTCQIIMGGQHISANPEAFMRANPFVGQVVTGDAINVIGSIVDGLNTERIIHGGNAEMSDFPLLDPNLIEKAGYPTDPRHTFPTDGRKSTDFMFGKGCFHHCDFCVAGSREGGHVSVIPYDELDQQLRIFKDSSYEELIVQDDAFLWDKAHIRQHLPTILGLMKKYDFYWQNNGGVEFEGLDDFATKQIIDYNSNGRGKCTALYVPFNPRSWNKRQSAAHSMTTRYHRNADNLKRLRDAGIYIFTSSIIGSPDQTWNTFHEELEAVHSLIETGYLDAALPLSATMLPGTKWYEQNGHNIVNPLDYPGYSLFTTHHRTEYLEPHEIETMMIMWLKSLDDVQKTYDWGCAFPNN